LMLFVFIFDVRLTGLRLFSSRFMFIRPLATWASLIPFCSPVVMMARIPFGVPGTVPYSQLLLSMFLLVAGFLFTTWISAKIYRTGILMYGKKATWKEIWKWAFLKN